MTDHWKDVREKLGIGGLGWRVIEEARAKDAEALERTQAALDKAVETLRGVSRGCESPRSEHVASIGRFVDEGLAEVKRLRTGA